MKKILGIIFELPMILLVLGSFIASIYAAYNEISGVTYASSIVLGIVLVLYFIGAYLISTSDATVVDLGDES